MTTRVGIYGYGNLGKGIECAVKAASDMELVAVFTRRDPATVKILTEGVAVVSVNDVESYKDKIDVMILCGGSATDLPVQTPALAKLFNVVDSFDTHAKIPEHFPDLTTRQKHTRLCYVVLKEGADAKKVEEQIKTMPNYFSDYDTTVNFISQEELNANHSGIPHGGFVIRSGSTGVNGQNKHIIEYSLKLDSNPEFTASVIVAYTRAVARLYKEASFGCKTVFDIAPAYLSPLSGEELRATML